MAMPPKISNLTSQIFLILLGTMIVMALPILNGGPFFYFDSATYIEQLPKIVHALFPASSEASIANAPTEHSGFGVPDVDKVVTSGRSVYYSGLVYAGWVTSIWLPIFVQSLILSWLVVSLFYHLEIPYRGVSALGTLVVISMFSSASFFAGMIMPDIWAGLLILSLALHWTAGPSFSSFSKWALFAVLSYSVLVHTSHFALLATMTVAFVLYHAFRARRFHIPLNLVAIPALALAVGVLGQIAFLSAVHIGYGGEVMQRPFFTARLVDLGPGTRLLKETCPVNGFALCAYADKLPVRWTEFLFDADPETGVFFVAPLSLQKAIADEQMRFAISSLLFEPRVTVSGLLLDGIRQLWTISIDNIALDRSQTLFIEINFPPDIIEYLKKAIIYNSPSLIATLRTAIWISTAISMIVLLAYLMQRYFRIPKYEGDKRVFDTTTVILAGLFFNALICGILASPYGRFQARVIWLLPLAAIVIVISEGAARRFVNSTPAPWPPLASPVPTRPDGQTAPGRIIAIECLRIQGRYTSPRRWRRWRHQPRLSIGAGIVPPGWG